MKRVFRTYGLVYCFLGFFILIGCGVRRPKDVIPESTLENLLFDYHIAKAMGDGLPYSENYKRALFLEDVFKKYGTTQAQFDSSMVWYTRHTEILSKIYERVGTRLKEELNEVQRLISIREQKPSMSQPGDSIDVWFLERVYRLTGHSLNNKITFNLPADTNFHNRDTLSWQVRYKFLGNEADSNRLAIMAMHIVYDNDSIISDLRKIIASGLESIRLQSDTLGKIREIKGFIYFHAPDDPVKSLWIDSISLMRYHSRDTLVIAPRDTVVMESVPEPKLEEVKQDTAILRDNIPLLPRTERARPSATNR